MRHIILISVFLFSSLMTTGVHSKIYKWIDENGKTHMSDKPPKTIDFDEIKVKVNVISSQSPSKKSDTTTANQNQSAASSKKVIMYGAEWCGVCKKAKRYFNANNIPFTEYDIDKSTKGRREYEKLGGGGIPIILIGKQRMNGFSASSFQQYYK